MFSSSFRYLEYAQGSPSADEPPRQLEHREFVLRRLASRSTSSKTLVADAERRFAIAQEKDGLVVAGATFVRVRRRGPLVTITVGAILDRVDL